MRFANAPSMRRMASSLLLIGALALSLPACVVGEGMTPMGSPGTDAGGPAGDGSPTGGAVPTPGDPNAPTGGADAGPAAVDTLAAFGACMTLADWDAANLGQIALIQSNQGACTTCHGAGTYGVYLNADNVLTFEQSKVRPYVLQYADLGVQDEFVLPDTLVVKGQDPAHPSYTMPAALQQGLQQFFDATNARYVANGGNCPAEAL